MTISFVDAGAGVGGTGSIVPALPAGIQLDDILILVCESAGTEAISTPSGWSILDQAYETGDASTGTRLSVFWKRVVGGEGDPTVSDPGDHVVGRIAAYRGCRSTGNPWSAVGGGVKASASTSTTITGVTTNVANCLVLNIIASPFDTSTSNQVSGWTNGNLSGITERFDNFTTSGNGGGIGMAEGLKATAGSTGNTTVTQTNSAVSASMMVALDPSSVITHVGTEFTSNTAGNVADDLTVNVPSGTANGDVMLACIYKAANSVHTVTAPGGWTAMPSGAIDTTNIYGNVWYRVASSEPANYTWAVNSTGVWGAAISTFRGVDTSDPIHAENGASYTTQDPATAPTVSTSIRTNIVTFRASRDDSTTEVTHTSAHTELADWGNDGGGGTRNGAIYFSGSTEPSGTAGGLSVNPSGSVTNGAMFTIALSVLEGDTSAAGGTATLSVTANTSSNSISFTAQGIG